MTRAGVNKAPLKAKHFMSEPFEAQDFSGTALTKEECVAPPVLAILYIRYPALTRWANV